MQTEYRGWADQGGDRHILTVSVEDYFHAGVFRGSFSEKHWGRFEPHLEKNLKNTLSLLSSYQAKATFFLLGCIAEEQPELVRMISDAGHEIASSGYLPRSLDELTPEDFEEDLDRAKETLEAAGAANPIVGYRLPRNWLRKNDLWILEVLADRGYAYDSSMSPVMPPMSSCRSCRIVARQSTSTGRPDIWEVPISTSGLFGLRIAISGGNYIRQLPHTFLRHATARWLRKRQAPLVFYFMPWELDTQQPKFSTLSKAGQLRHYRNLGKTRWVLQYYLDRLEFHGIADHLGLSLAKRQPHPCKPQQVSEPCRPFFDHGIVVRRDVSVVIPLFNEEENLCYLKRTLLELRETLQGSCRVEFVLVDDGSQDETWAKSQSEFSDVEDCRLVRHSLNRGVAAAIQTGIQAARHDIVCSMDCDCSYDPLELVEMLPLIDDCDIVTASPYHPDGTALNVPGWRLFLSKGLSKLYSIMLGRRMYTYTSCFRVYRRESVRKFEVKHGDFLGVAELMICGQLAGARIVEYPTVLESRLLGVSKMKTIRTIHGHLRILWGLATRRIRGHTDRLHQSKPIA